MCWWTWVVRCAATDGEPNLTRAVKRERYVYGSRVYLSSLAAAARTRTFPLTTSGCMMWSDTLPIQLMHPPNIVEMKQGYLCKHSKVFLNKRGTHNEAEGKKCRKGPFYHPKIECESNIITMIQQNYHHN